MQDFKLIHLIIAFCIAVMAGCIHMLIRNEKVYRLRRYVADLSDEYEARTGKNGYDRFYYRLPSYAKMVSGNEPIRLESYFTDEEIKELLNL